MKNALDSTGTMTTSICLRVRMALGLKIFRNRAEVTSDCLDLDGFRLEVGTCTQPKSVTGQESISCSDWVPFEERVRS